MNVTIAVAQKEHYDFAQLICDTIEISALQRGTGIAKRTPEYIVKKIDMQDAVIALADGKFAGFCYIESWEHGKFVAHSGLIVHPDYRHLGLAKKIKSFVFEYSQKKYPDAKIFGITTGLAVMKINSELGYRPVPFSELTDDPSFWAGCKTCTNFDILQRKENKMCLCTGMLYDPNETHIKKNFSSDEMKKWVPDDLGQTITFSEEKKNQKEQYTFNQKVLTRLKNIKQVLFLKK